MLLWRSAKTDGHDSSHHEEAENDRPLGGTGFGGRRFHGLDSKTTRELWHYERPSLSIGGHLRRSVKDFFLKEAAQKSQLRGIQR